MLADRPLPFDALLRPRLREDGRHGFNWHQGGGVLAATRVDPDAQAPQSLDPERLAACVGDYPLMPGFALQVRERGGALHAQATGQGEFPLQPAGEDVFEAAAYGIELRFIRGADGEVVSPQLHQDGRVLTGELQTAAPLAETLQGGGLLAQDPSPSKRGKERLLLVGQPLRGR